jgi:hypothetical protein
VFRGSVGTASNTPRVSGELIGFMVTVLKKYIPGSHTQSWLLKKKFKYLLVIYNRGSLFVKRQITALKFISSFMKPGGPVRVLK